MYVGACQKSGNEVVGANYVFVDVLLFVAFVSAICHFRYCIWFNYGVKNWLIVVGCGIV